MPLRPSDLRVVRPAITAIAVAVIGASIVGLAVPAAAGAATLPSRPHGEHVVAIGHRSLTVALPTVAGAATYRLYVSTRRSDLTVAHIGRARHSRTASHPRVTAKGLRYTTARYYWRVRVGAHGTTRLGRRIGSITLRPSTPTDVRATSSTRGTWLTWHAAAGYQRTEVMQAADAAMTRGRRIATLRGATGQFTPYATTVGRTQWYRVRTINGTSASPWSARTHVVVRSRLQPMSIMTYNVLTSRADGTVTTGERIAPWSRRRAGVVAMIADAAPDIVCVQEGGGWSGSPQGYGGTRQVDDLAASLPAYTLARTETPPTEHHYYRTGNYVLYRSALYRTAAPGGYWNIGDTRTAAYQLVQNRRSGARLLVVSAHLNFGAGRRFDDQRARETRTLLALAGAMSAKVAAPVVYGGDFNSVLNRNHAYDSAGDVMRAAGIADSRLAAQSFGPDTTYNSANLYRRTPPRVSQSIDYVFAPPGVAVTSYSLLIDLVRGRFVGTIPSDHNPVLVAGSYPY